MSNTLASVSACDGRHVVAWSWYSRELTQPFRGRTRRSHQLCCLQRRRSSRHPARSGVSAKVCNCFRWRMRSHFARRSRTSLVTMPSSCSTLLTMPRTCTMWCRFYACKVTKASRNGRAIPSYLALAKNEGPFPEIRDKLRP